MNKLTITFMVLISVVIVFVFSGCSNDQTFEKKNYVLEAVAVNELVINATDREVIVDVSSDNQIHIEYYESEKEYYNITSNNGILTMELLFNKEWTDFIGTKPSKEYRQIKVEIPNNILTSLNIITTNENIELKNVPLFENITLNSNGVNVILERASAGNEINLTAKNGNIEGTIVGSWDEYAIHSEIKKGNNNLPAEKTADLNHLPLIVITGI